MHFITYVAHHVVSPSSTHAFVFKPQILEYAHVGRVHKDIVCCSDRALPRCRYLRNRFFHCFGQLVFTEVSVCCSSTRDSHVQEYVTVDDVQAMRAVQLLARTEGIISGLEPAHAVYHAMQVRMSNLRTSVLCFGDGAELRLDNVQVTFIWFVQHEHFLFDGCVAAPMIICHSHADFFLPAISYLICPCPN